MPFSIGERDYINTTAKQRFRNPNDGFDQDAGTFASRTTDLFNNTWSGFNHKTFFTNLIGLTQKEKFEAEAYDKFENQVAENMKLGAKDKETAIKWILEAEGLANEKDSSYICYSLGLGYDKEYLFNTKH